MTPATGRPQSESTDSKHTAHKPDRANPTPFGFFFVVAPAPPTPRWLYCGTYLSSEILALFPISLSLEAQARRNGTCHERQRVARLPTYLAAPSKARHLTIPRTHDPPRWGFLFPVLPVWSVLGLSCLVWFPLGHPIRTDH